MSDDLDNSLEEQLDKLEAAAQQGDQQHPIMRWLPIIIPGLAMVVLVVAGAFFITSEPEKPSLASQIPILSNDGQVKIDPTDTGGVDIPDQDKMVYDPMKQGSGDETDTKIAPAPEAPMTPPGGGLDLASAIPPPPGTLEPILPPPGAGGEAGALDLPKLPSADDAPALPPPAASASAIVPPPPAPPKDTKTAMATKTPGTMASSKTPAKAPATTASKAPKAGSSPAVSTTVVATAQTASLSKNYRVQIQSLNSQSQAEKAWDSWVKKHPDLLSGLSLTVQRAVIKGRGTFYRVQAGPFSDHVKADDVCRKLKNLGQDCLVIRP